MQTRNVTLYWYKFNKKDSYSVDSSISSKEITNLMVFLAKLKIKKLYRYERWPSKISLKVDREF